MKENGYINISFKTALIVIIALIVVFAIAIVVALKFTSTSSNNTVTTPEQEATQVQENIKNNYPVIKSDCTQDYHLQYVDLSNYSNYDLDKEFAKKELMNYDSYKDFCGAWNLVQKYYDNKQSYIVYSKFVRGKSILEARLADVIYNDSDSTLYVWDYSDGATDEIKGYVIVIPTDSIVETINIEKTYTQEEKNVLLGNNPLSGYHFSTKDNSSMAEVCQINTTDSNINTIINNMLNFTAAQHTIIAETSNYGFSKSTAIENLDLIDSISKIDITDGNKKTTKYNTYTDYGITHYAPENDLSEFSLGELVYGSSLERKDRKYTLSEFFSSYELDLLTKKDAYTDFNAFEEGRFYVVVAKNSTKTETYYVDKGNFSLGQIKVEVEGKETISSSFSYTNDIITLPSYVYSK